MKTPVSSATANNNSNTNGSNSTPTAPIVPKTEPTLSGSDGNSSLQFQAPNTTSSSAAKRPISLDLNKLATTKKARGAVSPSPILNTPDLEKIILASNLLSTPQPGLVFPTKNGVVTSEQEEFGKGFEEALHRMHTSKSSQLNNNVTTTAAVTTAAAASITTTAGTGMSGGSFTYTNLDSSFPVAIKDEPENTHPSPSVSPIDMLTQEKIKLERKRMRNRVAASKCRKRKLERISKLEDKVKILKGENADLGLVVKNLKDQVAQLKQQVIDHSKAGCSIPAIYSSATLLQTK